MLKRELEHDVTDLFLAKCAANREKDRDFNLALLRHGVVDASLAQSRVSSMPVDEAAKGRISDLIARLLKAASPDARPHTGV